MSVLSLDVFMTLVIYWKYSIFRSSVLRCALREWEVLDHFPPSEMKIYRQIERFEMRVAGVGGTQPLAAVWDEEWDEIDHLPASAMTTEIAYHRDPSKIGRKDRSGITVLAKAGTTYYLVPQDKCVCHFCQVMFCVSYHLRIAAGNLSAFHLTEFWSTNSKK